MTVRLSWCAARVTRPSSSREKTSGPATFQMPCSGVPVETSTPRRRRRRRRSAEGGSRAGERWCRRRSRTDRVHEFEELGGAHDGVRRRPLAEQLLLQGLGPVVVELGHLVHTDDRQDHLVPDTGTLPRRQQVVHGGAEEVQGRLVEGRRVGQVDHDLRAVQRRSRPSPVIRSTPVDSAAGTAWCPAAVNFRTTCEPIRPVPPMTVSFMPVSFPQRATPGPGGAAAGPADLGWADRARRRAAQRWPWPCSAALEFGLSRLVPLAQRTGHLSHERR